MPYRALHPRLELAGTISCPPYDVVTTEEARKIVAENPESFMRVIRPEAGLPPGTDPTSDAAYTKARCELAKYLGESKLTRTTSPCVFVYSQRAYTHTQTGIVACCHFNDYRSNVIRRHEKTRVDKEQDRLRLLQTLKVHTGLVFMAYRENAILAKMMRDVMVTLPFLDLTDSANVRHTVWKLIRPELAVKAFEEVPNAYIADGHHRAAAAATYCEQIAVNGPARLAQEPYCGFPAVLFPAKECKIFAYNRLISDLNGLSVDGFLAAVAQRFALRETVNGFPDMPGQIMMFVARNWYALRTKNQPSDVVDGLDVSVLQDQLLAPVLGITDPRSDPRLEFVGGMQTIGRLEEGVNSGRCAVAFSLYPVPIARVMDVADQGRIMPPKSTWFEPKLRSGLLMHIME